jgi:DNA-binding HxlR family transcriptional regulator
MTESPRQLVSSASREELVRTLLTSPWRHQVLQTLAGRPERYRDIKAQLLRHLGALNAPTERMISAALRDLERLGLAEKGGGPRSPWKITALGATVLRDVGLLARIGRSRRHSRKPIAAGDDTPAAFPPRRPSDTLPTDNSASGGRAVLLGGSDVNGVPELNTAVAHPARRYDYWLGGKDNFAVDREAGDELERRFPGMRAGARANRHALARIAHYLAAEASIGQFLDVGTGIPTSPNTHEIAQAVNPRARVVYVDNDPLVLSHARALLTSTPEGETTYLHLDLREPERILDALRRGDTLDLTRPVALLLMAVLHFVRDREQARTIVRHLMDALPSGSYLAVTQFTLDFLPDHEKAAYREMLAAGQGDAWPIERQQFDRLFDDLDLVDPGIVLVSDWRPDGQAPQVDPSRISIWAGVARKP